MTTTTSFVPLVTLPHRHRAWLSATSSDRLRFQRCLQSDLGSRERLVVVALTEEAQAFWVQWVPRAVLYTSVEEWSAVSEVVRQFQQAHVPLALAVVWDAPLPPPLALQEWVSTSVWWFTSAVRLDPQWSSWVWRYPCPDPEFRGCLWQGQDPRQTTLVQAHTVVSEPVPPFLPRLRAFFERVHEC